MLIPCTLRLPQFCDASQRVSEKLTIHLADNTATASEPDDMAIDAADATEAQLKLDLKAAKKQIGAVLGKDTVRDVLKQLRGRSLSEQIGSLRNFGVPLDLPSSHPEPKKKQKKEQQKPKPKKEKQKKQLQPKIEKPKIVKSKIVKSKIEKPKVEKPKAAKPKQQKAASIPEPMDDTAEVQVGSHFLQRRASNCLWRDALQCHTSSSSVLQKELPPPPKKPSTCCCLAISILSCQFICEVTVTEVPSDSSDCFSVRLLLRSSYLIFCSAERLKDKTITLSVAVLAERLGTSHPFLELHPGTIPFNFTTRAQMGRY